MTDLHHTLPSFFSTTNSTTETTTTTTATPNLPAYTPHHLLLSSLEKTHITTADLLTLEPGEIARRAQLPATHAQVNDIRRLVEYVRNALGKDLGLAGGEGGGGGGRGELKQSGRDLVANQRWRMISTLDKSLDEALGGGIPTGYITEVTGERCVWTFSFVRVTVIEKAF